MRHKVEVQVTVKVVVFYDIDDSSNYSSNELQKSSEKVISEYILEEMNTDYLIDNLSDETGWCIDSLVAAVKI